jgi:hypothetical protein
LDNQKKVNNHKGILLRLVLILPDVSSKIDSSFNVQKFLIHNLTKIHRKPSQNVNPRRSKIGFFQKRKRRPKLEKINLHQINKNKGISQIASPQSKYFTISILIKAQNKKFENASLEELESIVLQKFQNKLKRSVAYFEDPGKENTNQKNTIKIANLFIKTLNETKKAKQNKKKLRSDKMYQKYRENEKLLYSEVISKVLHYEPNISPKTVQKT